MGDPLLHIRDMETIALEPLKVKEEGGALSLKRLKLGYQVTVIKLPQTWPLPRPLP